MEMRDVASAKTCARDRADAQPPARGNGRGRAHGADHRLEPAGRAVVAERREEAVGPRAAPMHVREVDHAHENLHPWVARGRAPGPCDVRAHLARAGAAEHAAHIVLDPVTE